MAISLNRLLVGGASPSSTNIADFTRASEGKPVSKSTNVVSVVTSSLGFKSDKNKERLGVLLGNTNVGKKLNSSGLSSLVDGSMDSMSKTKSMLGGRIGDKSAINSLFEDCPPGSNNRTHNSLMYAGARDFALNNGCDENAISSLKDTYGQGIDLGGMSDKLGKLTDKMSLGSGITLDEVKGGLSSVGGAIKDGLCSDTELNLSLAGIGSGISGLLDGLSFPDFPDIGSMDIGDINIPDFDLDSLVSGIAGIGASLANIDLNMCDDVKDKNKDAATFSTTLNSSFGDMSKGIKGNKGSGFLKDMDKNSDSLNLDTAVSNKNSTLISITNKSDLDKSKDPDSAYILMSKNMDIDDMEFTNSSKVNTISRKQSLNKKPVIDTTGNTTNKLSDANKVTISSGKCDGPFGGMCKIYEIR